MEFKHIEYFPEAEGHSPKATAAEALSVSQQALSRTIAGLEAELGCELFHRSAKGISPTREGRYLYRQMEPVVREFHEAQARTLRHVRRCRQEADLAYGPQTFRLLDMSLVIGCQDAHPGMSMRRHEMSDHEVLDYVRADARRLGLLGFPGVPVPAGLEFRMVVERPMALYVHEGSELARLDHVSFAQLVGERLLMLEEGSLTHDLVEARCRAAGFEPNKAYISSDVTQLYKLVEGGAGVCIGLDTTRIATNYPHIRLVPFADPVAFRMAFVCQSFDRLPEAARAFVEHVGQLYG